MELTFVVNPIAGHGLALQVEEKLKAEAQRLKLNARFLRSEHKGHATQLAREAAASSDTVVSVGGDGTSYEVSCGLLDADSNAALGIIPAGTGNDYIKTVGIPAEPVAALHHLLDKPARPVDIGLVNDKPFLNVCGTGFDVMVLDCAEKFKGKMQGLLPYMLGLLNAIASYHPVHIRCQVDGGAVEERDVLICSVANGRYIGGGIPICPDAAPDDGLLDLMLLDHVPRRRIPFYLPGLMGKKVLSFGITHRVRCREVSIESPGMRVQVDGEISPMDKVHFRILPGKLMLHW